MPDAISIQLMGNFLIHINETRVEDPVQRSRKGAALMEFLILHNGQKVPNQVLLNTLWSGSSVTNPANALKTLVSRMRQFLNDISDGFGACIASDRGAYRWQFAESVQIDVIEIMSIYSKINASRGGELNRDLYRKLIRLYAGDLYQTGDLEEETAYAEQLHSQYLNAVYTYIDHLKAHEEYIEISDVCRRALEIDSFDDRLHIELMRAMVNLNRTSDAVSQFKQAANLTTRYLDAEPSEEIRHYFGQLTRTPKTLRFNLDAFRQELMETRVERGAFLCELPIFRAIYNLQMRARERTGTTNMYLCALMVGSEDEPQSEYRDTLCLRLMSTVQENLRKGDIITQHSSTVLLLLMSFPDLDTGRMVLERIRQLYIGISQGSNMALHYRLGRLGEPGIEAIG